MWVTWLECHCDTIHNILSFLALRPRISLPKTIWNSLSASQLPAMCLQEFEGGKKKKKKKHLQKYFKYFLLFFFFFSFWFTFLFLARTKNFSSFFIKSKKDSSYYFTFNILSYDSLPFPSLCFKDYHALDVLVLFFFFFFFSLHEGLGKFLRKNTRES